MVTGGCGFIGTNLVFELLKQGAIVFVLDLPSANWSRLPKKVSHIKADILNKKDLLGVFENVDIVYHLAARTDLDSKNTIDYKVNYEGTKNIINGLSNIKNSCRLIFYSTQLVVGLFNEKRFIDETEPYKTKTAYGYSKIMGEEIVIKYCNKRSIPYTIIRPTSVYGPWGEAPYKEFFQTIKRQKYYHIGKADNFVSMVYVKNLVNFTILTSIKKEAENEIYFGNDFYPYTMREIADTVGDYYKIKISTIPNFVITPAAYLLGLLKIIGFKVPIYPFRLKNIKMTYCYNVQKGISLGYVAQYDLKEGIKETLNWYESKKLI